MVVKQVGWLLEYLLDYCEFFNGIFFIIIYYLLNKKYKYLDFKILIFFYCIFVYIKGVRIVYILVCLNLELFCCQLKGWRGEREGVCVVIEVMYVLLELVYKI